jgi:hypothetical protein
MGPPRRVLANPLRALVDSRADPTCLHTSRFSSGLTMARLIGGDYNYCNHIDKLCKHKQKMI